MPPVEIPDLFAVPRETRLNAREHLEGRVVSEVPAFEPFCDTLPGLRPRRVDIGKVGLFVEEQGHGGPLVLLHGGPGASHHTFHPAFTRLDDKFRVIYYDQRGCGQSEYKAGPGYSIKQSVADLESLRGALGIDRWAVLGHSYGGFLAQAYAAAHPAAVTGLILVCAAVPAPVGLEPSRYAECLTPNETTVQDALFARADFTPAQLMYNILLNGRWKRHHYYRPTRETMARIARYEFTCAPGYEQAILRDWPSWDLRGRFDDGRIPTLIVEGRWDQTWHTDKPAKLHALHPQARLEMFDAASHQPFNDEPDRFFPLLEEFLAGLPR
ncbi:alpha/beta fold hydrolase [bacterium]|nr:alpha/beta fold hydrolase [bacterium]